MKTILLFLLLTVAAFLDKPVVETAISNPQFTGATPRFTTDQRGNPLLTWAERETEKQAAFYFAVSTDGGQTFGPKAQIPVLASLSTHAEGMPKVAIKSNGTMVALFEVPNPTEASRFAGDLLFVSSPNAREGAERTWTKPAPVHQITTPGESHSFADLTRLPNGEIGIVWLDVKLPEQEGRSVKFKQTLPEGGFGPEIIVDSNACQCCRTSVFVDSKGQIHLTYRDLIPTGAKTPAARDMSRVTSTDGGKTFSKPLLIYADDWRVAACPHAGSSVAQVGNDVFTTWFSGKEKAEGLRLAKIGQSALVSTVMSARAKHPQVVAYNNKPAWLWDESVRLPGQHPDEPMPTFTQRIALRTFPTGPATYLTPETVNATYPVGIATAKGLLVAFEQKSGSGNPQIVTQLIARPQ